MNDKGLLADSICIARLFPRILTFHMTLLLALGSAFFAYLHVDWLGFTGNGYTFSQEPKNDST